MQALQCKVSFSERKFEMWKENESTIKRISNIVKEPWLWKASYKMSKNTWILALKDLKNLNESKVTYNLRKSKTNASFTLKRESNSTKER